MNPSEIRDLLETNIQTRLEVKYGVKVNPSTMWTTERYKDDIKQYLNDNKGKSNAFNSVIEDLLKFV